MGALVETGLGHDIIEGLPPKNSNRNLKAALRQADRQQNVVRKTKTWNSERTAFEPPQPQAIPKEKGVRNALRRKLKKPAVTKLSTAINSRPPSLFRSDSFDYGDELKRRPTQIHFAPAPSPRDAQSDAKKAQLLNLRAEQKQRRAQQKADEKRIREQEKAQRQALARQLKQERLWEYWRALTSPHPRQNLKLIRHGPNLANGERLPQQYHAGSPRGYRHSPVSVVSWLGNTSVLSQDFISPSVSPAPPYNTHNTPQELSAFNRPPASQQKVEPVEVSTDLPDRELQMCKPKPNLVFCDICSATVCLSGNFYSCSVCGPREGGIVCSGCLHENKRCRAGLHELESSIQVVQRVSNTLTWRSHKPTAKAPEVKSQKSEPSEDSAALSRISADTASHSLCLATMQKKITRVEAGIETQSKSTERLASWLEEAMERQREQAADLTKSMLEEFRAERMVSMNTIKRLSTKRKPRRQNSEGSHQLVPISRDCLKERELALREREFTLREREMTLQERREAAKERPEKLAASSNPLPSQSLAFGPNQENRLLLDVLNKLNHIEALSAMRTRQASAINEKIIEQAVERAVCQLTLVTSGFREHAGTKRKADAAGTSSSIQPTPTTGLSTNSSLQPPSRNVGRGNQDNDGDDGHSPKRSKNQPTSVPESGNPRLLACPFSKLDFARYSHKNAREINYRGCSSCVLTDISRLKQHLYRVHQYPAFHCPRCFDDLVNKDRLNRHLRDGCEARECPYPEKFSDSSELKKKWPGKSMADSWYKVFKILFPGHRLPASPYAEDLATGGTALAAPNTPTQPLPVLSLSPEVISDVVRRQLERRSISDTDHQHDFLFSLVQDATIEALGLISPSPTPITNSNPSSAVPRSGTLATTPGPDSATNRQDDALDPSLLSAGTGTMNSTFGTFRNLQDLSSLGSGINDDVPLFDTSSKPPTASSNHSSGTFSGLSSPSGAEILTAFDDDLIQLTSNEIAQPIKPSSSMRTVDSGYRSMLTNDGLLDCYPPPTLGDGPPETRSASSSSGNHSTTDSLFDPETFDRLVREHGDDFGDMLFGWNLENGLGVGVGGGGRQCS